MTPRRYLTILLIGAAALITTGAYFYREVNRIPVRIAESDETMLKTDSMRHVFKVTLLNGRAYEAYLSYIHTGEPDDLKKAVNFTKASIGFAASAIVDDDTLDSRVIPIIRRNLEITESISSPQEAAGYLAQFGQNMADVYRETEHIEQDIWISFLEDFVRFQTGEKRALIAYQFSAALAGAILLIMLFFFFRQRLLIRIIETREHDLEELIDLRNEELALLRETQAAAEAADRAKTEFLALMSHELRTPLNAIVGFSEIVKRRDQKWVSQEKTTEYAAAIHSASMHLLHVINDILDLAKIEAGQIQLDESQIELTRLIQRAEMLIRQRAQEKGQILRVDAEPSLPILIADERLVFQILINLLSNAVKFTGQRGEIVAFAALSDDGGLDLGVRDNGIGIEEADLPKVMQPFGQLRQNSSVTHEGTGLGLPLSRRFAELHEASISIESRVGEGTTVTVHFPASRVLARPVVVNKPVAAESL